MQITRSSLDTIRGPATWSTGDVYIDPISNPSDTSSLGAAVVHFTPGARTAWHVHPLGQTIWVSEGIGLCQCEGGPIEVIRPGDCIVFEPGESHWHGATPTRFMTHVAIQQADSEGNVVTWGEHVSDQQYLQALPLLATNARETA